MRISEISGEELLEGMIDMEDWPPTRDDCLAANARILDLEERLMQIAAREAGFFVSDE